MLKRLILSSAFGLGIVAGAPTIASACMNAVEVEGNAAVKRIAKAEKQLSQGKLNQAKRTLATHRIRFVDAGHRRRAMLVLSAVEFRAAGASTANYMVQHYIAEIEHALKKDQDSPVLLSRLAEGYAMDRKTTDKAQLILTDLSTRDLMPDAFGFRTLAILQAADKDMKSAKIALASCKQMTKRKDLCSLGPLASEKRGAAKVPRSRSKSVSAFK